MTELTGRMRTLTAFFDERLPAQKAIDDLVAAGIPDGSIQLAEGMGTTAVDEQGKSTAHKGFWDELKDLFLPDQDRHSYAEGLSRGGYLLSVQVEDASWDRARDILDTDGAVDMDSREAEWKAGGWNSSAAGSSLAIPAASSPTAPTPQGAPSPRLLREPDGQRPRLRAYSMQNDLESGFPTGRTDPA